MTDRPQTWQWGEEEPRLERLLFSRRLLLIAVCFLLTLFLGWNAVHVKPDASFEKMIPVEHPYVRAMLKHIADLGAAGTSVQIVVEHKDGDIFHAGYLETLRLVTDSAFYLPGVDRNRMRSLWTPNVRWTAVTEDGFEGDLVVDAGYDGSDASLKRLRQNLLRSGEVGRLVATDFRSSIVELPLFDRDPRTGVALDYWDLSERLESDIRAQYQSESIEIRIIGFAKMVGDLLDGIKAIFLFGLVTFLITAVLLAVYSRSLRATAAVLFCSIVAVIWQLGLLRVLGFGIDAFSILVPFLVFAIAVSHGVQVVNVVAREMISGASSKESAKRAFRQLYIPGSTALASDAVGFMTMLMMPIQVIRELGIAASVGVAVVIFTNLVLLPVLLSYAGLGERSLEHARRASGRKSIILRALERCPTRPYAPALLALAGAFAFAGVFIGQGLQIGDLDAGAPELRPDSRYNLDNAYVTRNYSTSSDVLIVMVETEVEQCAEYRNLWLFDEFLWVMANVEGVESAIGASTVSKLVLSGYNEGSLKWATVTRNQDALNTTFNRMPEQLMNRDCSLLPAVLFLSDHRADTLNRVTGAIEQFAAAHNTESLRFVPAAGNAGIEAAINQEIAASRLQILLLVYGAVAVLVLVSFGSLRAVLCILLPLALTSVLCQALMALLGIGVKVATLPVIALGVGVGVDYGIYVFARFNQRIRQGADVADAWSATVESTGKAVAFTGFTLAIGVATWMFSPIKFQADMGVLLTFMFLLNMVGALTLLPALASYLYAREHQR